MEITAALWLMLDSFVEADGVFGHGGRADAGTGEERTGVVEV
ncbi:hypothetical protein [Streptomyces sp. NPDC050546]